MKERVIAAFKPDGELARRLPEFHPRPAQIEMASLVADVFTRGLMGIVEAGTGTGKSLAYLAPALALLPSEERLVISTQTIHLQQQIMAKDLPLAQGLIPDPPVVALLFGRGNYLCRRKVYGWKENIASLSHEERRFLLQIDDVLNKELGHRHEMPFIIENSLWNLLASESKTCLRSNCPWNAACFWQNARKSAYNARVVVVNHHLLLADLAIRLQSGWETERAILPAYQWVVADEAHHLEDVAADYLGFHLDEEEFRFRMERLLRRDGHKKRGWLPGLKEKMLDRAQDLAALRDILSLLEHDVIPAMTELETEGEGFFKAIKALAEKHGHGNANRVWRFKKDLMEDDGLEPAATGFLRAMEIVAERISRLVDGLENDKPGNEEAIFLAETGRDFTELYRSLPSALNGVDRDNVHWLERSGTHAIYGALHQAPLELGPLFHKAFLTNLHGAVFTSATLTVGGRTDYFQEGLGLNRVHPSLRREAVLPPAFDYRRQALVLCPKDIPEPDRSDYIPTIVDLLPEILQESQGRAFVLFTNRQQMMDIYQQVEPKLKKLGMNLLVQGQAARHRLVHRFKRADAPVLFGMDSFWEGVDIPGDKLSCVVLTRLPFRVPSEPIQEARIEALQHVGADAFNRLSLPQAVIKFKQGFGRLIRTQNDRGVVVVLDARLVNKPYGKRFINSLPGGEVRFISRKQTAEHIRHWMVNDNVEHKEERG